MPYNGQHQLAELGDFLTALRLSGVPVGPADIDRLRQLFALQPRLDRDHLHNLLSALLVKTPAQRDVFEALFADWCPDHDADWPEGVAPAPEAHTAQSTTSAPRTQRLSPDLDLAAAPELPRHLVLRWLLVTAIGVLLAAVLIWWWWPVDIHVEKPPVDPATPLKPPPVGATAPEDLPATPVDRA